DIFYVQRLDFIIKIFQSLFVCFLIGLLFFYFNSYFKITPKTILIFNIFFFGLFFYGWRKLYLKIFSKSFKKRVAFLGEHKLNKIIEERIKTNPYLGLEIVLTLTKNQNFNYFIEKYKIENLILTIDVSKDKKLLKKLLNCLPYGVDFYNLPDLYEEIFHKIPIDYIDQKWFLENFSEGNKKIYDNIKRIIDIFLSLFFIILTFPLWLIFSILIKNEDKGPIFYKQKRVGKNGKIFELIKFRTMIVNAEEKGAQWAEKDDKRITKIGKFLRKTHLDEIPQMLNILRGNISFVGPRPERPEFVEKLSKKIPYYNLRHIIKPGFTGWAQINFSYARTIEDSKEKLEYDFYYIKNRSLILDLGIILKTFQLLFKEN
ncbi:MAG: sugar transferase, partial [Minisyncoccia bacterium]